MKLNIAYSVTGMHKLIDIHDEMKVRPFYEKRMGQVVSGDCLGEEFKGYEFRISGGNDKQGFPMMQGVLTNGRARLLLKKGSGCYRPRRTGERKRKSVRGCIVDANLSVLALNIVKKGEQELPGITDQTRPNNLGPKRASRIRKFFNLTWEDDVTQYVIPKPRPVKEGKEPRFKVPKVQRLITERTIARRQVRKDMKKQKRERSRIATAEYAKLLALRKKEAHEAKELKRKRTNSLRLSKMSKQ